MKLIFKSLAFLLLAASVSLAQTPADTIAEMKEEISIRDSVMAVHDSSCSMEKDSLRKVIETEQAKSANWEQSYNMVKTENDVCTKALGVTIEVSQKKKEEDEHSAAMASGSSFLGGLGLGFLIMWLIMR